MLRIFASILIFGFLSCAYLYKKVGGNFNPNIKTAKKALSLDAKDLIKRAYQNIDTQKLLDFHVHIAGTGTGGTGAYINPAMDSFWHPFKRMKFNVYLSASGVTDLEQADQQFVKRLVSLARDAGVGRYQILAFDQHFNADGTVNEEHTEFYIPNDYISKVAKEHSDVFVPAISVHPDNPKALSELDRWAREGIKVIKWLPNAMGINPSLSRYKAFYQKVIEHDMIILTHAGEEAAVDSDEYQKLGNPLFLRTPLNMGVKIVIAHCAGLGTNVDFEHKDKPEAENFDLFLRLMNDKDYEKNLWGEISAMTIFTRMGREMAEIIERTELHHRLLNGSDYPLPAINIIVRTGQIEDLGFITEIEAELTKRLTNC